MPRKLKFHRRSPLEVGLLTYDLLTRRWFVSLDLTHEENKYLPRLIFALYMASLNGEVVNRSKAQQIMRLAHGRSQQRYVARAEALGLIEIERRTKKDARADALRPTKKLKELAKQELNALLSQLINFWVVAPP